MGVSPAHGDTSSSYDEDAISSFFRLSVDHRNAAVVVGGELDRRHTHLLLDGLGTLVHTPHRVWTVDLTDVTFCDTSGLGSLVEGHDFARAHDRDLTVVGASECVHRQLTMGGLEPLLCTSPLPPDRSGGLARRPLPAYAHRGDVVRRQPARPS